METEDSQDPSSRFEVPFPYDPNRPQLTDDKGAGISADFEGNNSDSSKDSNPYTKPNSSLPSRRGISSQKYRLPTSSSLAGINTMKDKSEKSLRKKIDTGIRRFLSSEEQYGLIDDSPPSGSATSSFLGWLSDKKRKAKKAMLKAYDGMVGIDRAEFQRRLQLNDENVDLFELQREMFIEACKTHNCD
ncbi:MAG: hypothetical protein OXJ52_03485 [Oligoflexia bacterium]|nr:hypothetical protein [Oligoflexia bacterium]